MMHTTFDDTAELAAREQLVSLFLPLAMSLEADHFRVLLAVCAEDSISLQKLGRINHLGQSEVIRATSVLEHTSLLTNRMEDGVKSYRRLATLTSHGIALREAMQAAFGDAWMESALNFHQFVQQELLAQDEEPTPAMASETPFSPFPA